MYKITFNQQGEPSGVLRSIDNACIPFDPANTDYQRFKQDIAEGAELQDAEGNTMSPSEAMAFLEELP